MMQQFYPQVQHSYKYELNKDMHFAAAHFVPHESAGACQYVHGHTYFVNVTIAGDHTDAAGFLVNFKDIKAAVHKKYDHTLINDHDEFNISMGGGIPSTEHMAHQIWINVQELLQQDGRDAKCLQVIVRETPTSYVVFRPSIDDFERLNGTSSMESYDEELADILAEED